MSIAINFLRTKRNAWFVYANGLLLGVSRASDREVALADAAREWPGQGPFALKSYVTLMAEQSRPRQTTLTPGP